MFSVISTFTDITIDEKVTLGCNNFINKKYERVDNNIEINIILLKQSEVIVALISVDTLFISGIQFDNMHKALNYKYNIEKSNLIICASHTHYAPYLDESKPKLGHVNKNYQKYFNTKFQKLCDKLSLMKDDQCVIKYYENNINDVTVSRRNKAWGLKKKIILYKSMRIYPNLENSIDKKIRIIEFTSNITNNTKCVIWNFACHPVMYYNPINLSSHYIGDIRTYLRNIYGNISIIFMQGFSGDIRPFNVYYTNKIREKILNYLNNSSDFQAFTKRTYNKWLCKLKSGVENCLNNGKKNLGDNYLKVRYTKMSINEIMTSDNESNLSMTAIYLTDRLVILTVSAEVVSKYSLKLFKLYEDRYDIVPVGCVPHTFGYWPTKCMLSEGGYEVNGFKKSFSVKGVFKEQVEYKFFEMAKNILD